jgi:hypothetical protein
MLRRSRVAQQTLHPASAIDGPNPFEAFLALTSGDINTMCQRVTCSSCGKPTYAGCGRHIEAVLGDVPQAERCQCRSKQAAGHEQEKKGLLDTLIQSFRRSP